MALPEDVTPSPPLEPFDNPVTAQSELLPPGGIYWNYFGGHVFGSLLAYSDLADYAWWVPLRLPDRFGSSYRETLSEILRGVRQADVAASERLTPTSRLELGQSVHYHTIIRPLQSIAFLTASRELAAPPYEQHVAYETARERLHRTYPATILATTQTALGKATAPAHEIVEYVFSLWREIYPWFDYEPVPPLYWFIKDENGDYTTTPERGIIQLRQDRDSPISMASFIDTLLRTFQGYGFRYNLNGRFQVLPAPWALSMLLDEVTPAIDPAYVRAGSVLSPPAPVPDGYVDGSGGMPVLLSEQVLGVTVRARSFIEDQTTGETIAGPIGISLGPAEQVQELHPGDPVFNGVGTVGGPVAFTFTYTYPLGPRNVSSGLIRLWLQYNQGTDTIDVVSVSAPDEWVAAIDESGQPTDLRPLSWVFQVEAHSLPPWGIRSMILTENEVKDVLPVGTLDLERIVNLQKASIERMDFVDEQTILTGVFTKHAAGFDSDYQPGGKEHVERGTTTYFMDDGEPILVGSDPISVAWKWTLRRSSSTSPSTGDPASGEAEGEIELLPGELRTITITLNGVPDQMFGPFVYITFERVGSEGNSGIIASVHGGAQSTNALASRPYFCHFVEFDVQGSVWTASGERIQTAYGVGAITDEGDTLTALSASTFGVREGSPIRVEFFDADYEMLMDICRSSVLFGRQARRRWDDVPLTAASPITPEDLNKLVLLPNGTAAVMDSYEYIDNRTYLQVSATRSIALEELYTLAVDTGGPAVDALTNPTENAVAIHGLSWLV